MKKEQLVAALKHAELRASQLAAENDRLRHALEIAEANRRLVWDKGARPAQVVKRAGFQRTPEQEAARQQAMDLGRVVRVGEHA